jgi:replicative DNA helicase
VSDKQPDEADRKKNGTLDEDIKAGTKLVSAEIPRVHSMRDLLTASRVNAFSQKEIKSLTMGHYKLDSITGGFRPPFTWVIAADTSWGKSSMVVAIADENIKKGKVVLIASQEDTEDVYGDRFMIRRSGVNAARYRDHKLSREEMQKVLEQEAKGEPLPVFMFTKGWKIEDLVPHWLRLIKDEDVDLIIFDYLQEFETKRRFQDERVKYKEIAATLRGVGKTAGIPSIVLSQLTITEKTGIPTRANIRECRDVANAADGILIGFEPDKDLTDKEGRIVVEAGTKCVSVDKCKNGERGRKVSMKWNGHSACFDTVVDPDLERFQAAANAAGDFSEFDNTDWRTR